MLKNRFETWVGLIVVAICLVAAGFPLWGYGLTGPAST